MLWFTKSVFPMAFLLLPPLEKPSPFPFISDKGKRHLRKQLSEKESCLSCLVSHKSRTEYLQALFCLTQTENVNFNLLHLALELGQKPTNATTNPLGFWKPQPMSQACKWQYCIMLPPAVPQSQQGLLSHQKFLSEGDNPSQRTYQTCSHQDCQPCTCAGLYCYFLTSSDCSESLAAIQTYRRLTLLILVTKRD